MGVTLDQLRKTIRDHMLDEWLWGEPGTDCFDRDETGMTLLTDFIEHGTGAREVRAHLLACCRCRHIYANMRFRP